MSENPQEWIPILLLVSAAMSGIMCYILSPKLNPKQYGKVLGALYMMLVYLVGIVIWGMLAFGTYLVLWFSYKLGINPTPMGALALFFIFIGLVGIADHFTRRM